LQLLARKARDLPDRANHHSIILTQIRPIFEQDKQWAQQEMMQTPGQHMVIPGASPSDITMQSHCDQAVHIRFQCWCVCMAECNNFARTEVLSIHENKLRHQPPASLESSPALRDRNAGAGTFRTGLPHMPAFSWPQGLNDEVFTVVRSVGKPD
jgi:hypothetical protein